MYEYDRWEVLEIPNKMKPSSVIPHPSGIYRLMIPVILMEACFLAMAWLRNWDESLITFLALYFVALSGYGYLLTQVLRKDSYHFANAFRTIAIVAVLFRVTVLFSPPSLSEDFYRYLWDGKIQKEGIGPYDYAPQAPELQQYRDATYEKINHKEFRTIYPPFAQNLFSVLARISDHMLAFKLAFLLFDLLLIETLRRLLEKEGKHPTLLLIYAWHPLPVIEFAGSGHMDIVALSTLFISFLLIHSRRPLMGGTFYGIALLSKYLPVLVAPWMVKQGKWKFAITATVTGLLVIIPFWTADLRMFDSLLVFSTKFRFNDSMFGVFYDWFGGAGPARAWGIFLTLLVILICLFAKFDFYRSSFMVVGAWILFSPVVHPWYLCWMIPFLVFHHSKPWLFLTGWIVLSYLIRMMYPDGLWEPVLWLKLLVYLPFYVLLTFDLFRRSRKT